MLDVPGATQDGLEIKPGPMAGTLVVRAEAKAAPHGAPLLTERSAGPSDAVRYHRLVPVAWDADVAKAKPTVSNGVLVVTIPRAQAQATHDKKEK